MNIHDKNLPKMLIFAVITLASPPTLWALSCDPESGTSTKISPYRDGGKFVGVINNSLRLQFPSSSECISQSDLKKRLVLRDHFYERSGKLYFDMRDGKSSNRLELRGKNFAGNKTGKKWTGNFNLPNRLGSSSYTVGQLFSDTNGQPIIRIAFQENKENKRSNLWIFYRTSSGSIDSRPLGNAPDSTNAGTVTINYGDNNQVSVNYKRSGVNTTEKFNLDGWDSSKQSLYYKAGCYLQESGDCRVTFNSLSFSG